MSTQSSKSSTEHVLLLTFVINRFRNWIFHCSRTRFRRIGLKHITILGDIAQYGDIPLALFSHFPCHLGLIVEEIGFVVAFGIQRAQHILGCLVANTMHLTLHTIPPTYIGAST